LNNSNLTLGNLGEQKAKEYLLNKGYQILEKNWKHQKYEIDIIAIDGAELVIIEVKTRRNVLISIEK
jgi:putative endonuclease